MSMCVYIYIYVCVCVYIYIYIYIYIRQTSRKYMQACFCPVHSDPGWPRTEPFHTFGSVNPKLKAQTVQLGPCRGVTILRVLFKPLFIRLSKAGEKSIEFYSILVPLRQVKFKKKSIQVWYSRTQKGSLENYAHALPSSYALRVLARSADLNCLPYGSKYSLFKDFGAFMGTKNHK